MEEMKRAPAVASAELQEALFAFARTPGQWRVQGRQPEALFASIPLILSIAGSTREADDEVRAAARFFIRAGLLYPDADPRAVFGYAEGAEPIGLKERHRLLARLTHPDRAAALGLQWPEGTAARVNRACEVLSAPALPAALPALRRAVSPAPPSLRRKAAFPVGVRTSCALACVVAVVGGVLLDTPEGGQLVQVPARPVRMAAAVPVAAYEVFDAAPMQLHLSRRLGQAER